MRRSHTTVVVSIHYCKDCGGKTIKKTLTLNHRPIIISDSS